MNELDKGSNIGIQVESKAGERGPLSSNKANVRSPALELTKANLSVSEKDQLEYLAGILVDAFLKQNKYGDN